MGSPMIGHSIFPITFAVVVLLLVLFDSNSTQSMSVHCSSHKLSYNRTLS